MRVQSVPGQDELPQTFETIAEIDADARLNRLRLLSVPYGVNPLARGRTGGARGARPGGRSPRPRR